MKTRSPSYSPPLAGLALLLVLALLAAGCTQPTADGHAQTLKITGSTTVLPVAQAAADAFTDSLDPDA